MAGVQALSAAVWRAARPPSPIAQSHHVLKAGRDNLTRSASDVLQRHIVLYDS